MLIRCRKMLNLILVFFVFLSSFNASIVNSDSLFTQTSDRPISAVDITNAVIRDTNMCTVEMLRDRDTTCNFQSARRTIGQADIKGLSNIICLVPHIYENLFSYYGNTVRYNYSYQCPVVILTYIHNQDGKKR